MSAVASAPWNFRVMAQYVLLASAVAALDTTTTTTVTFEPTAIPGVTDSFTVTTAFPSTVFSSYHGEKPDPSTHRSSRDQLIDVFLVQRSQVIWRNRSRPSMTPS